MAHLPPDPWNTFGGAWARRKPTKEERVMFQQELTAAIRTFTGTTHHTEDTPIGKYVYGLRIVTTHEPVSALPRIMELRKYRHLFMYAHDAYHDAYANWFIEDDPTGFAQQAYDGARTELESLRNHLAQWVEEDYAAWMPNH